VLLPFFLILQGQAFFRETLSEVRFRWLRDLSPVHRGKVHTGCVEMSDELVLKLIEEEKRLSYLGNIRCYQAKPSLGPSAVAEVRRLW
jgi:hypothetical protein